MFDPICAGPARDDDACRKTIPVWQRRAIHLIGDDRILAHGNRHRNAFNEIRCFVDCGSICSVEHNFDRLLLDGDFVEDVLEASPSPTCTAHRPIPPLNARDMGLEEPAPITGTLAYSDDLHCRHAFQITERELGLSICSFAPDGKLPCLGADFRDVRKVVADKERVVGGYCGAQIFDWRFVIRRPICQLDERLLAGQCIKNGFLARSLG